MNELLILAAALAPFIVVPLAILSRCTGEPFFDELVGFTLAPSFADQELLEFLAQIQEATWLALYVPSHLLCAEPGITITVAPRITIGVDVGIGPRL